MSLVWVFPEMMSSSLLSYFTAQLPFSLISWQINPTWLADYHTFKFLWTIIFKHGCLILIRREFVVLWSCSPPASFRESWPHWSHPGNVRPDVKVRDNSNSIELVAVPIAESFGLTVGSSKKASSAWSRSHPIDTPMMTDWWVDVEGKRGKELVGWKEADVHGPWRHLSILSSERPRQQKGADGKVSRRQSAEWMLNSRSKNAAT